jgi:hypothetical protein
MPAARAAMAAAAKNAYLVYKVAFLQNNNFSMGCKYTLSAAETGRTK